jgi:hypothetical protein
LHSLILIQERRSDMKKTRREFVKLVGGAAIGAGALLAAGGKARAQITPAKGYQPNL